MDSAEGLQVLLNGGRSVRRGRRISVSPDGEHWFGITTPAEQAELDDYYDRLGSDCLVTCASTPFAQHATNVSATNKPSPQEG